MNRVNRILPVYPADISGVCSALYELGGMTVMHDASGCNSTYTTHDEPRWYSMDSMVYISALSELEAVMGDDEKLVEDIVDAAAHLRPKFICIGGTPIPMMMGTDFKGIARMIERRTGIPSFGISTNGMHSYVLGAGEALKHIVLRFCPPKEKMGKVMEIMGGRRLAQEKGNLPVNILGATPLDFSLTGNVGRMKAFLNSRGMDVVSCWAMESCLEELEIAGSAGVNLVVSSAGIPAAQALTALYGTPYVIGTPVGRRTADRLAKLIVLAAKTGTNQVLFDEGGLWSERKADGLVMYESGGQTGECLGIPGLPGSLTGRRVLIIGEQVIANSLRCSLREDYGAAEVTVLCAGEGERAFAREGDMIAWDEDQAAVKIADSHVVIGDPLYRLVCGRDWPGVFVDFPHEACSGRMFHHLMKPFIC